MPPEPSEGYLAAVDMLDNVVRECMFVSRDYGDILAPTGRHYYASVLFTALVGRGASFISLAPHSPWNSKLIEHWDYASMAGIVRTMIETRLIFHYICVDPCSDDEWSCRWNLLNLHDCCSRIRMFQESGTTESLAALQSSAEGLRDRLRGNPFFAQMEPKRQKERLKGGSAYLKSLEDLAEACGFGRQKYRYYNVFFSAHVHSLPMSFFRLHAGKEGRGTGLPSAVEEDYSSLCLALAGSLLVQSRDALHALFEQFRKPRTLKPPSDEAEATLVQEGKNGLAIGSSRNLFDRGELTVDLTRAEETLWVIRYRLRRTGEIVLERHEHEVDGSSIEMFDPVFWNVEINGLPAVNSAVDLVFSGAHMFRTDIETRTLGLKIEVDRLGGQRKGVVSSQRDRVAPDSAAN